MEVRRAGIGTRRKTEGEPVAWFARARLLRRTIAPVRARSRVTAHLPSNRRRSAENRLLLFPVMIFLRSWFDWGFRELTGEIFFARSPRVEMEVSTGRMQANLQGKKALFQNVKLLNLLNIFPAKNFRASGLAMARTSA